MGDIKESIKNITKYNNGDPISSFKLTYDAQTNQLEPIYYWILDFMQDAGIGVEKITDNFMSSPGSGHFADMGQRATKMQEEGMKILGLVNQVTKTILNLIYDLKEFEIRIAHYNDAKSDNKQLKEAALLSLKQIWLDNVDMKRGRGSIHQMTYELGYTTLREVFLIANSLDDLERMASKEGTINDQVKRILVPRLSEFLKWKEISEQELTKRFNIEKSYLRTEVESLKLYTSWVRPYLKAAEELRQKGFEKSPALVSAFSTSMFELNLFGKRKDNKLLDHFKDYPLKRDYYSCYVVSLKYRGHLSQRATQKGDYAFGFGGRVDMTFDSYCLNSNELDLIKKEMAKQDVEDGLKLFQEATDQSLEQLKADIDHFLGKEKSEKQKEEAKKKQDDTNPFSAIFSLFTMKKDDKKKEITTVKDIKPDNFVEESVREETAKEAKSMMYAIYDVYKKAHGMASSPENFDN